MNRGCGNRARGRTRGRESLDDGLGNVACLVARAKLREATEMPRADSHSKVRAAAAAVLLVVLCPGVRAAPAVALPDVDAIVSYQTRQVLASGVERQERWQERLVRRGDRVWTERVLPRAARAAHGHESPAEHAAHKHFDFESAARLVSQGAGGAVELQYVDTRRRVVVNVPKAEFGAVGFDGRWDAAASIVPPAVVAGMPLLRGTPRVAGSGNVWHVEKDGEWSHRVLWSVDRRIALRVESARLDGSVRRVVTVEPAKPGSAGAPWADTAAYAQKEYDDFMD